MTDSSMVALTRSINQIGEAFEEFKKVNDQRIEALNSGKDSLAKELGEKLGRIEGDISKVTDLKKQIETEMKLQRERIEELETRASKPGKTAGEKLADEYRSTFNDWLRQRGQSASHEQRMQELQRKAHETKAVTIASPAGGGYAVPEEIRREIERLEKKFSPVRDLVSVVQIGTSDYKELIDLKGTSSGWVGESGSRTATNTPTLREIVPTQGELYAYPQVSEWSLDDIFFNVEQWLAESVAEEFAIQEGTAVISGNGTSKPTGMTNTAPVSTADFASPLRAAAAYQFVPSLSDSSPPVAEVMPDALIDLVYTLNTRYRAMATFVMNSMTTGAVRKLKDSTGQYLWSPGLANGQPDRLLGYPLATWEQMDDISTNGLPIAFGDFKRGYVLVDRTGMRITRDDVTAIGHVKFFVRRREGGIVKNNDAIKFLKTTIA